MTAVEWLGKQLETNNYISKNEHWVIELAKEIEKQQIIDAWEDGQNLFPTISAKQYYNETFKKK